MVHTSVNYKSFKLLIHSNMKQPSKKWLRQPPDVGKMSIITNQYKSKFPPPKNALYVFRIANEEMGPHGKFPDPIMIINNNQEMVHLHLSSALFLRRRAFSTAGSTTQDRPNGDGASAQPCGGSGFGGGWLQMKGEG